MDSKGIVIILALLITTVGLEWINQEVLYDCLLTSELHYKHCMEYKGINNHFYY